MMRNYYHISKTFLGTEFKFIPKIPGASLISSEGDIPRVCVSPYIEFCIRSIISHDPIEAVDMLEFLCKNKKLLVNPCIYSTTEIPFIPPDASDFRHNSEHWFLSNVKMSFVSRLCIQNFIYEDKIVLVDEEFSNLTKQFITDNNREIKINKMSKRKTK